MVTDDAIRDPVFDHVIGYIAFAGILKARDKIPAAIEFGHGVELILIQEALHQRAVHLLADAMSQKTNTTVTFPILSTSEQVTHGIRRSVPFGLPRFDNPPSNVRRPF